MVGVSISPGHTAASLVLALQRQEEKKPSFKKLFKKKDLNEYPSVRNCFMEQFSSFSTFLKYCSSIIVTVSSSGGALK